MSHLQPTDLNLDDHFGSPLRDESKLAQLIRAMVSFSLGRQIPKSQMYMDLRYIDPRSRVLNECFN